MERVKLTIKGKQGPFAVRKFLTKETLDIGEMANSETPMHEQYLNICQMALCYEKSGKPAFTNKDKMDKDLGGGQVIRIAQQAMIYNGIMDQEAIADQVEKAQKNS